MIPRRTFLGYLTGLCTGIISAVRAHAWFKAPPRARQHSATRPENPLNSETASIESAVDFALEDSQFCWHIPSAYKPVLKDRLVRAETDFSQGRILGVQEQNISEAFNFFAERLGAPDYAFTSLLQVRLLRMSGSDKDDNEIPSDMRPAQALYLVRSLMFRKLHLPDYQVPPKQWDETYYPRMVENLRLNQKVREQYEERRKQSEELPKQMPSGRASLRLEVRPTKYNELYEIVFQSVSSLSFENGLSLLDEGLRIMGFPGSFTPWQKSV